MNQARDHSIRSKLYAVMSNYPVYEHEPWNPLKGYEQFIFMLRIVISISAG